MSKFLDNKDIQGQNLLTKTTDYMVNKYRQIKQVFSYSDPYGQIILVLQNLTKINMSYIRHSINEMSFHTAQRKESIYGLAQLQGHNSFRGSGATTSITLSIKDKGVNLSELGSQILLPNYMRLKCKQNGSMYYLNLGQDFTKIDINSKNKKSLVVNQGEMMQTKFISRGGDIQTYSIHPTNKMVDMNHIMIQVNGEIYNIYEGVMDFEYGGKNCMVRTGLTGGIDIIFGKEVSSEIPQIGQEILIFYPIVDGSKGNHRYPIFEFVDQGYKLTGEGIEMGEVFNAIPESPLEFGSDGESVEETRLIAPNVSKNRIIHDKKSLKYFLDKMNLFGNVMIYNNNQPNVLETFVFPKLINIVGDSETYFDFNREKVLLTDETKLRLLKLMSPKRSQNIDVIIKNPIIKDYSMVVKVDIFGSGINGVDVNFDDVRETIKSTISDYMLNMKRTNKIPKSDIVRIVDSVHFVDSVHVDFMVEDEIMLDEFGNIVVKDNELALPSNNFVDHNGNQIHESFHLDIKLVK